MKKSSWKNEKKDTMQCLNRIWSKHDFSCFRKKSRKKSLFFIFRNSKSMSDKKCKFCRENTEIFFFNFLNHFLTLFCLKWKKFQKNLTKMIQINFYTKFGQNTTFHVLEKKVEKSHFFSFFDSQNRCLTNNVSFVEKIQRTFFFNFLSLFLIPFWLK